MSQPSERASLDENPLSIFTDLISANASVRLHQCAPYLRFLMKKTSQQGGAALIIHKYNT